MNTYNLRLLTASIAALTTLSLVPLKAQTTWTNGAGDSSWSNALNWDNGSPATIGATAVVLIGTQPTGNLIGIDTGVATTATIASLTFKSSLTGDVEITNAGGETLQVNGAITNSSSFNDSFTLSVVAGANATYAGGSTGGSLNFGTSLDLQTFNVTMTGTVNVTGSLLGTTGVLTIGDGVNASTVTLSNSNTYAGGTAIVGGTLKLSGIGTLGATTGALAINTGGTLDLGGLSQTVGALTLGTGGSTITTSTGTATLTTTGVTVNGTSNTIAANVTVAGNTTFGSGAALADNGAVTGTMTIGNGALSGTGSVSGATTLNGGTINFGSGGSLGGTLGVTGGNWNGAGSVTGLVTSSSGTFTIGSGANLTANGGLNVTGGSIVAGNASSTITGSVNYTSGTGSTFGGIIAGAGKTLTMNSSGVTLILTGSSTYTGVTTITAGTLQFGNGGASGGIANGNIVDNGALVVDRNNTVTDNNVISGTGSVTQEGTGTVIVTTANTYHGGTFITNGTLQLSGAGTLGDTAGTLAVSGTGTLDLNGLSQTVGALTLGTGGSTITTSTGTATLTTTGVTVNGASNTIAANVTVAGAITQSASSALTVNGTGGSDALANLATLAGTGTVGAVTLAGNNTLSSTGTLATGGITVSSTGNAISTGIVSGAITQNASSALTVNGTGGADALANLATLAGTGTVGAVTLAGNNTLSSTGTLHTSSIAVSGTGNQISTGTVQGNTTQNAASALAVNGTLTGTDSLTAGATALSGTGTISGVVTLNGGGNTVSSTGTLATGGLTVNNSNNTISSGIVSGAITQNASSALTVNGTGGSDALANLATLAGTGTVGTVTLAGNNTLSSTGTLHTGGITVNSTGNAISTGIVSGAITQNASSALTVNGTGGSDALANLATLAGTGTVGAVTLAGNNTLSSSGTLTTASISVSGASNTIVSGTVAGATTINSGGSLIVGSGATASGTVLVSSGGTLGGLGTTGATTISSGGAVNLSDSTIGTLHVGSLSTTAGALTFEIGTGGTTQIDKIAAGALTIGSGTTTLTIANLGGTGQTLTDGTYTLLTYTNGSLPANLGNLSLSTTLLDGQTLSLVTNVVGSIELQVSAPSNPAAYTLVASAANGRIMVTTGSTTITSTITNTGTAGNVTYTGLNASTSGGSLAGGTLPKDGGPLTPNGGTDSGTTTLSAGGTTGAVTVTPTVTSVVDTGGTPSVTTTTTTVDVVDNRVVSASSVDFGRVLVGHAVSTTSNLSTTGDNAHFTSVTVGTAGADANGISATGGTNPTFNGAGVTDTRTVGGTFSTAGQVTNAPLTLTTTGEGLAGEAPINVTLDYSADAVNKRVITNGATTNLGILHSGSTVSATSNAFTTTGTHVTTTDVTVAAGSGTADGNGVTLTGGATTFNGTTSSDTRTFGGTITGAGTVNGSFNLAVNTLENSGAGLAGEGVYSSVAVAYTANVYSGLGVWNTNGSGSWGTVAGSGAGAFGLNWGAGQGSPGLDPNFANTDTATFGSALTSGTGTVTLDGASPSLKSITFNDAAGSYVIAQGSGGTLKLNNGAGTATVTDTAGNHTISAPVELDSNMAAVVANAYTLTLSGAIGEAGGAKSVMLSGPGTIVFSAANTYTGGTTLNSGTLNLIGAGTLGAATGALNVAGGTLDLGGVNRTVGAVAITGDSTIQNGTLTGTSYTASAASGTATVNAILAGGGSALTKSGASTLALNGANTYGGGTTISAGTVAVGNLSGLGTGNVTMSGGTLQTGNSVHQINVGGTYTQTGGTLVLNLTGTTAGADPGYEFLNVGGGTGTANLGGALRVNVSNPYVPVVGDSFTFVQAGTINGGFTSVSTNLFSLSITLQGAGIIIAQVPIATLPGVTYSPNESAVAQYIDTSFQGGAASPGFVTLLTSLDNVINGGNPQSLTSALDQLTPEKFGNFARSTIFNNTSFSTQMFDSYFEGQRTAHGEFHASDGQIDSSNLTILDPSMDSGLAQVHSHLLAWNPAPLAHGMLSDTSDPVIAGVDTKEMKPVTTQENGHDFNTFILGNVVLAQNFSQADLAHSDTTTGAVQVGADYRITPHLRAGVIFGYGHTDADLDNIGSKATVDSYAPGVYASFADNGWYANVLGSYGFDSFTEDRHVDFGGLTGVAHGAPSGDQIVGNLDGGYDFHVNRWTFGPSAGVQYTHLDVDSFTEDGADAVDLQVNKQETDSLRSRLGGHMSYAFQTGKVVLTPHLDASWQHEFLDQSRGITSQFTNVGVGSFTINTPNASRDSALIDGGLNADLNGQVSLYLDYLVQAGQSNYFGQAVQAGVKIGF